MKTLQVTFENCYRYKGDSYNKLLELGYDVELVGLYDAEKLKGTAVECLVRNETNSNTEEFSLPEICCYLGHLKAWNMVLDMESDYCLIVEDDAIPLVTPDVIEEKLETLESFDAVQLVTRESNYWDHNEHFLKGVPCGYGLIAYILSKKGAKALIDQQNLKAADLKIMQLSMQGDVFSEKVCSFAHDWSIPSTIQGREI